MIAASEVDTRVNLGGLKLRNPVLAASGTFGYGSEFAPFFDLERIGGFVAKSLTLEPRAGNPPPRIAEAPSALLNAISLENIGVRAFIEEKLPLIPEAVPVIASMFGTEISAYAEVARRLSASPRVAALEINASCPHVKSGGIEFGQDPRVLGELVEAVRPATSLPLLVKLSPNVTNIGAMARVCEQAGADALSLINAVQALEVDVETRRPVLGNILGGLSGPAIRPIALRMVWQASQAVSLPICGIGGDFHSRGCGEIPPLWGDGGPSRDRELPQSHGSAGNRGRSSRLCGSTGLRSCHRSGGRPERLS